MRIVKDEHLVKFSEVKQGDVFQFEFPTNDGIYIKIDGKAFGWNSVNLEKGTLHKFEDRMTVIHRHLACLLLHGIKNEDIILQEV